MNARLATRSFATLTLVVATGGAATAAPGHRSTARHSPPIGPHDRQATSSRAPATFPAPNASTTELYYGGPVISHVQVVNVLWGSSVASAIATGSEGFYKALVASDFLDALGEYDTVGVMAQGGATSTHQRIYRGTFVKTVTIQPMNTSSTVTLTQVGTEIDAQVKAGILPAPVKDPDGTLDTLYAIAFPSSVTVTDGTTNSCSGFGALHDVISVSGLMVPFSVTADCGSGSLDGFTQSASHEFAEAVTDATPSATTPVVGVQAWNDSQGNEVADVCESGGGSTATMGSYSVATYWSNRLGACVAGDTHLGLCNGSMRPCRPCSAQDCTAPQICDTNPSSATQGQCVAATPDAGSSTSSGSSGSSGSGSSSGSASGGSSSGGSSSGSGSAGSSGGTGSGASGSTGSGTSSSGASSGGSSGSGSGGGPIGGSDAGVYDAGVEVGNGANPSSASGCACTNAPGGAGEAGGAGVLGLLGAAAFLARARRRP